MRTFEDFFIHLIEDERFYENASRNHRKETVESTARKIYEVESIKWEVFESTPIEEHRKHLLNKLYKLPPDKVKKPWYEIQLEQKEKEKKATEPEWIPLTGEERQKRLQEFLEVVKSAPPVKVIAPISHREIMLNGQVDKPKEPPYPSTKESEVIAHALHLEYLKQNYDAYTKLKLENWMPEEEWLKSLEE